MQNPREVERLPSCPRLTVNKIKQITRLVFAKSSPQKSDILIVPGSSFGNWNEVADLMLKGYAPSALVTGGNYDLYTQGMLQCDWIAENLKRNGVSESQIRVDSRAKNTKEDARYALDALISTPLARILLAVKAPHSGRCLLTFRRYFPNSDISVFIYGFDYRGERVGEELRATWPDNSLSRSIVWGEYQRILLYGSRGDITLP